MVFEEGRTAYGVRLTATAIDRNRSVVFTFFLFFTFAFRLLPFALLYLFTSLPLYLFTPLPLYLFPSFSK
jgi:hypothetical protein